MLRTEDLVPGFQIGAWHVQPLLNRITGPSEIVHLEPRVMRVLLCLAERPGEVVPRESIREAVWGSTIVGKDSLSRTILDLRKAFGDNPQNPLFIETIRGVGYRLIAPVALGSGPPSGDSFGGDGSSPVLANRMEDAPSAPHALSKPNYLRWGMVFSVVLLVGLTGFLIARLTLPSATLPLQSVPLTSFTGVEFDPALSPDGQHLAFVWDGPESDNLDIYLKQIGTETPIRFTDEPGPGFDGSPSWSADGRALAFMRTSKDGCGVYIRPMASSDERKVADCHFHSESAVAWSPDGTSIVFVDRLTPETPFQLFLVSTETLKVQPLTEPPAHTYGDLDPTFSPDGTTVAFIRGVLEGSLARLVSPALGDIHLVTLPGGEPRRLTFDNQEIPGLSWTPDGTRLVFSSTRGNGGFDLWEVSVTDGTIMPRLSTRGMIRNPALALHNHRLAYEDWERDIDIQRLPLTPMPGESVSPKAFIASTRAESTPRYSPDGTRIVFTSDRSGYPEIWTCDADGKQPVQLTRLEGPQTTSPRWSPDGQHIAFVSHAEGHADIYVIQANGGLPLRLTDDPHYDLVPSWSTDGQWVYFGSNRDGRWQVWKRHISRQGEAVQITQDGGFATQEVVQDADTLLYHTRVEDHGLWQRSLATGETRQTSLPLWKKDWGNWALHGEDIYFVHYQKRTTPVVSRYNLATGVIDSLTALSGNMTWSLPGMSVSPDGQWLLYTRPNNVTSDILMVEAYR